MIKFKQSQVLCGIINLRWLWRNSSQKTLIKHEKKKHKQISNNYTFVFNVILFTTTNKYDYWLSKQKESKSFNGNLHLKSNKFWFKIGQIKSKSPEFNKQVKSYKQIKIINKLNWQYIFAGNIEVRNRHLIFNWKNWYWIAVFYFNLYANKKLTITNEFWQYSKQIPKTYL